MVHGYLVGGLVSMRSCTDVAITSRHWGGAGKHGGVAPVGEEPGGCKLGWTECTGGRGRGGDEEKEERGKSEDDDHRGMSTMSLELAADCHAAAGSLRCASQTMLAASLTRLHSLIRKLGINARQEPGSIASIWRSGEHRGGGHEAE
jgi:hypothetical protein